MRKIILLSFLFVGIGLFMNAQTIATFEDLDEDLLYFSDYGTSGDPHSGLTMVGLLKAAYHK